MAMSLLSRSRSLCPPATLLEVAAPATDIATVGVEQRMTQAQTDQQFAAVPQYASKRLSNGAPVSGRRRNEFAASVRRRI